MDYISVSDIDPHMTHIIKYISGLGVLHTADRFSAGPLRSGLSGKAVSEMTVYGLYKAGAVTSVC